MRSGQIRRRTIGLALGALGLLLATASAVLALTMPNDVAGDVNAVETALGDRLDGEADPPVVPSANPAAVSAESHEPALDPEPLWEPNPVSRLADLGEKGPTPVGLRIEAIGVDAPIDPYGVDRRDGQMDVPHNVEDVAWYQFGSRPGEPGSAVLAAHVDLAGQGPGVFFHLRELDPGDRVGITYDDGSELWFRVEARITYHKDELPLDVIFSREGPPVLTLVTCGGGFSASNRTYDSNVVVYAVPIDATPTSFSGQGRGGDSSKGGPLPLDGLMEKGD